VSNKKGYNNIISVMTSGTEK